MMFFLASLHIQSQYASIELNTGGFSFIPLFTSNKPHFILRAGTNVKKRLSLNLINLIMMDGFHPANYSLITRYKLLDKKFKLMVGLQLPGYRLFEKNHVVVDPLSHEDNFLHRTIHFWLARAHKGI